jgi:hypothetical protein
VGKFNTKQREYIIRKIKESKTESRYAYESGALMAMIAGFFILNTINMTVGPDTGTIIGPAIDPIVEKIIKALSPMADAAMVYFSATELLKAHGLEKRARELEDSLELNKLSGDEAVNNEGSRVR